MLFLLDLCKDCARPDIWRLKTLGISFRAAACDITAPSSRLSLTGSDGLVYTENGWFTSSAYLSQLKCWGNLLTWEQNWGWQTMILAQPRGGTSKLERQIDRPSLAVFLLSFFAGPGSPILIYPPRQFWINQIRAFSRPPSWETCALPKSLSRYLLFI